MLSKEKLDVRATEAFLLVQLRFFWQSNAFPSLKAKTDSIREKPVFLTHCKLAALVSDWWLRIDSSGVCQAVYWLYVTDEILSAGVMF